MSEKGEKQEVRIIARNGRGHQEQYPIATKRNSNGNIA